MNEVFDSEKIYVEYKKDDDIVLVVLKGKVTRDAFRTPMMHAADMVMRHSCKVLVVQFDADPELNEKDINWSKKILFNNLKKSGLEKLVLITAEPREIVKKTATFAGGRFKMIISKSYEEVKAKLDSSRMADEKYAKMTREEALEYMGLGLDADIKEIDDRFWQMSKKYRGKEDSESMEKEDEISAIYDIASGRRDIRVEEEERRKDEPMYFGRYKSDWDNIIQYNWKNWLLGAVLVVSALVVIIGYLVNSKTDCAVLVFGHMYLDNSYIREALMEQDFKNPYVGLADIVVPNDENIPMDKMGNEALNAQFYTDPDVLISDERSYLYYYTVFKDLTPLNDKIMAGLSEEAKAGIRPVYMSEREAVRYRNDMLLNNGYDSEEIRNPADFPDDPILIGYEITDRDIVTKMGVEAQWKSRQTTFVVGRCTNSKDDDKTVLIITTILNAAYKLA